MVWDGVPGYSVSISWQQGVDLLTWVSCRSPSQRFHYQNQTPRLFRGAQDIYHSNSVPNAFWNLTWTRYLYYRCKYTESQTGNPYFVKSRQCGHTSMMTSLNAVATKYQMTSQLTFSCIILETLLKFMLSKKKDNIFFQLQVFLTVSGMWLLLGFSVVFHLHEEFNLPGQDTHSFHTRLQTYRLISFSVLCATFLLCIRQVLK